MDNRKSQSSKPEEQLPSDENRVPIKKKRKRPPVDENGELIRRRRPAASEDAEPVNSEQSPAEDSVGAVENEPVSRQEDAEPVKRKQPAASEGGRPLRKRRPKPSDGGEHVRKRRQADDESSEHERRERPKPSENGGSVRKKRPPVDENGEPLRRKHTEASAEGRPVKRKRPPDDEKDEAVIKKRPKPSENSEPVRRKHLPDDEGSEPARRKRTAASENGEPKPVRRKRPPDDEPVRRRRRPSENEEPVRRKHPAVSEGSEPVRRKRTAASAEGKPVRRKRPPDYEYSGSVKHGRPSQNGRKKQGVRVMDGENKNKKPNNHNQEPEERYEDNSSRGCLFPVFLLLICVIIFVSSFTLLVGFMSDHSFNDLVSFIKGEEIAEDETEETTENSNYIDSNSLLTQAENQLYNTERTGVISQISLGTNTMRIYDIDSEASVTLNFDNSTELKNENGTSVAITEINEGDTVIFVYNEDRNLLSVQLNPDAEELTSLAVTVNTSRKLITIGNDVFKYNKNTVFRYNGSVLSPKDITEYDIITVKAIGYDAWGVIMEKCHGTLTFTNYENITDVTYSVDEGSFSPIPEDGILHLTEGVHNITVKSPSISDYTGKFIVKANSEEEINLANVSYLRGSLIVDTAATGAALYVDGVQKSLRNPMFLDYGSHKLTLTKYGNSVTKYITINKEETQTSINF